MDAAMAHQTLSHLSRLTTTTSAPFAIEDGDAPSWPHHSNGSEQATKLTSLLLRLINDTFLSLPIVDCYNITQLGGSNEAQRHVYDACFVNWSGAKLVQNPIITSNTSSRQLDEVLLSSFIENNDLSSFNLLANRQQQQQHLNHDGGNDRATTATPLGSNYTDYELVKTTYLSVSSFLSISGIFINLFIIFIIIFNTRQKRPRVRSGNIGKNNLLLVQLTVTGILLASYVLIDNINIHQYDVEQFKLSAQNKLCDSAIQAPSPLLTFLPPTPFHWHKSPCKRPLDEIRLNPTTTATTLSPTTTDDDVEFVQSSSSSPRQEQESTALILKFRGDQSQRSSSSLAQVLESKSWYLDYNDAQGEPRKIDLTESLNSIFVVETNCLQWKANSEEDGGVIGDQSGRIRKRMSAKLGENQDQREYNDNEEADDQQNQKKSNIEWPDVCKFFKSVKLFLTGLLPLVVNIVASVHIWTVAALAYDRYCAIAHPFEYLRSIHTSRTRTFFILSWIISLGLNVFLPISSRQIVDPDSSERREFNLGPEPYIISQWYSWIIDNIGQDLERETTVGKKSAGGGRFLASIQDYDPDGYETVRECLFSIPHLNFDSPTTSSQSRTSSFVPIDRLEGVWSRSKAMLRGKSGLGSINPELLQLATRMKLDLTAELGSILVESSSKIAWLQNHPKLAKLTRPTGSEQHSDERSYVALLLGYSLIGFVIIILVPLLIITVCNIKIYRIVKVHERRLSVSSASMLGANQFNGNFGLRKSRTLDTSERRDSLSSLLRVQLGKLGMFKDQQQVSSPTFEINSQVMQNCLLNNANGGPNRMATSSLAPSDTSSETNFSSQSSRLKRMTIGTPESYQILTKLNGHNNNTSSSIIPNSAQPSPPFSPTSKFKLKRKISDHCLGFASRKDSVVSQPLERGAEHTQTELVADSNSQCESPNVGGGDYASGYESGGIIHQLKLAGLSFAGISIQKRASDAALFHKTLHKSSSCSLANLQTVNQNWNGRSCGASLSKFSMESASTSMTNQKKSYVSLDATCKQYDESNTNRYITKLLDDEANIGHYQHQHHHHHHPRGHSMNYHLGQSRLPLTIGTKSATFNIVIWLIITMLIFTLPHYILVTIDHMMKLNSSDDWDNYLRTIHQVDLNIYYQHLHHLVNMIFSSDSLQQNETASTSQYGHQNQETLPDDSSNSFLKIGSIWLSCLCRILFLSMVPLNGCLYGISSRSLRSTLRMILKRYISKKQAFIEIDQRQRSISSERSRDSSFINMPPPLYYNHSACWNCSYQQPPATHERLFKRCSSFTANQREFLHNHQHHHHHHHQHPRRHNSSIGQNSNCRSQDDEPARTKVKSKASPTSNTIRFMIGDESIHQQNQQQQGGKQPPYIYPHQGSQTLSPGSSIRSLMSASLNSSLSLAYLIIDDKSTTTTTPKRPARRIGEVRQPRLNELIRVDQSSQQHELIKKKASSGLGDFTQTQNSVDSSSREDTNNLDTGIQLTSPDSSLGCSINNSPTEGKRDKQDTTTGRLRPQNDCTPPPPIVRKSSSEFKFVVTSVDQKEQNINLEAETKEGHQEEEETASASNLWNQIRHNLTKILLQASARLLSASLLDKDNKHNYISKRNWRLKLSDAEARKDLECSANLLRRSSVDNYSMSSSSPKRYQNMPPTLSPLGLRNEKTKKMKQNMHNSLTMSNIIDGEQHTMSHGGGYHQHQHQHHQHHNHNHHHHHRGKNNRGSTSSLDCSPTHLKPPNFLKLSFDPENPTNGYSTNAALSPIKECSSNHSYASSQSSLSNSNPAKASIGGSQRGGNRISSTSVDMNAAAAPV